MKCDPRKYFTDCTPLSPNIISSLDRIEDNDFSKNLLRIRINAETKANLKYNNIDVVRINRCLRDQKSVLISFSELFRKNEDI